jgi:hypothetical protein
MVGGREWLMGDASTHTSNVGEEERWAQRRAAGVFFTPPAVVRYIVQQTLGPLLNDRRDASPLQILEPSCGEGAFLAEAFRYLCDRRLDTCVQATTMPGADAAGLANPKSRLDTCVQATTTPGADAAGLANPKSRLDTCVQATTTQGVGERTGLLVQDAAGKWQLTAAEQRQVLLNSCFGLDIDPALVAAARGQLARLVTDDTAAERQSLLRGLRANIRCGDALLGPDFPPLPEGQGRERPVAWKRDFAPVWRGSDGGFDAVIGNPPYVNIRRLTSSRGAAVKRYLRSHYQCARGAFDLYVLFLELAFQVLRPGGLCGLIVPNKLAGLAYAAPCRALLLEQTTIERIVDLSQWRVFPEAGVYPYVMIWKKQKPAAGHRIAVVQAASETELETEQDRRDVPQSSLSASAGWQLHGTLDVESRVVTSPLGMLARLYSGTTGFVAEDVANVLTSEAASPAAIPGSDDFRFIVSGNIDRYLVRWGQARFMKRRFVRPVLPSAWAKLTDAKRQLFRSPKIVIAGMTRRIEAAWDPGGLALGVQVFATADFREDRRYLLGLLNSKLFSFLFRTRFRAKQLSGGFLAINKGQLDQLPIRIIEPNDRAAELVRQRLVRCVEPLERLMVQMSGVAAPSAALQRRIREFDRQIDQCAYHLYQVTADEIARIEAEVPSFP